MKSKFLTEFKEFAMRGNGVDLAVGSSRGAAFGKIVSSLVGDILMPILGLITGSIDFSALQWVIRKEVVDAAGEVIKPEVVMHYGVLIQNIFDFVIVAFAIFCVIRTMNNISKKKEEAVPAPEPPKPSEEVQLLSEIRDLLKKDK